MDAFLSIIGQKHVWPVSCLSILVKILSVVEQYLMLRQVWLACHKVKSDALFFAMGGDYSFMSDNTSGGSGARSKRPSGRSSSSGIVEGPSASIISTRASNSQVSVLMGHDCTKTTEQYYCRIGETEAIEDARTKW